MSLATSDVDFLRGLVARHSGNMIAQRQVYMLEQRLEPVAKARGLACVKQLVEELMRSGNSTLSDQVAEAVTVNETSFFRDMHMFEALRSTVLPQVIKRNQPTRELDIWCAASSSGQEPYSLAMLLAEHFPQLSSWRVNITATDLSEEMLRRARSGSYSQLEVNRGLPATKLPRFFDRDASVWQVKNELRDMIDFRRLNLAQPWPNFGYFDIVFIRNVLIYFDRETRVDILRRVRRCIRPKGYLFIGSAETVIGLGVPFERQEIDGTVSYRPRD